MTPIYVSLSVFLTVERWISGQFRNDNLPEEIFFNRLRTTKSKLKTGKLPDHIFVSNAGGKGNKA